MLRKAIPADSPVHFVMRADTSWSMERQFDLLKGVVRFWVAGEGTFSWYPEAGRRVMARGESGVDLRRHAGCGRSEHGRSR